MFDKTNNSYGVNEILLSSAIGGIVFGAFAGQPLCIVGVTGPIAIFNYTVYQIIVPRGTPYFPFMCWICLWSMVMHFIISIFNWIKFLKYITRFSCDIFGFFICFIYIQKGIQICTRQFNESDETQGYFSVMVALLVMIFGVLASVIGTDTKFLWRHVRGVLADYGTPATVVFFTGFVHIGRMQSTHINTLPTTGSFTPTYSGIGREYGWIIHFWEIEVSDVFLAIPFALLMTFLFYFDHNVSSLICQGSEFPLKKPASFHWDFFLLGITTGVSGILGIPPPNGLIPQAPLHSISLCRTSTRKIETPSSNSTSLSTAPVRLESYYSDIVEQRLSNFGQGLMILGTMSGPLLVVLGLVPQAVLAGLFWIMGLTGLKGNGITKKIAYIFTEAEYIDSENPFNQVSKKSLYIFVSLELIGFAAEFGITQTIAAVGFPGVLLGFGVLGYFIPRFIPSSDMPYLDEPTAADFILENLQLDDTNSPALSDYSTRTPADDEVIIFQEREEIELEEGLFGRRVRRRTLNDKN